MQSLQPERKTDSNEEPLLRTSDQWAPLEPPDRACDLPTMETPLAQTNLKGMDETTQCAARGKAAFLEISLRTSRPTVLPCRQRLNLLLHKASSAVSQAVTRERAARKLLSKWLRGTASHP